MKENLFTLLVLCFHRFGGFWKFLSWGTTEIFKTPQNDEMAQKV